MLIILMLLEFYKGKKMTVITTLNVFFSDEKMCIVNKCPYIFKVLQ